MLKHIALLVDDGVLFQDPMLDTKVEKLLHDRFTEIASKHNTLDQLSVRLAAWKRRFSPHEDIDAYFLETFDTFCQVPFNTVAPENFDKTLYAKIDSQKERGPCDAVNFEEAWGKTAQKIANLVDRAAWSFMDAQSAYYKDFHYSSDDGAEKCLCVTSSTHRPAIWTTLSVLRHMFIDATPDISFYANNKEADFTKPENILAAHNSYAFDAPGILTPQNVIYLTKDIPNLQWQNADIRQIVLAPGASPQKIGNIYIAGDFSAVLELTTEKTVDSTQPYIEQGRAPKPPGLH